MAGILENPDVLFPSQFLAGENRVVNREKFLNGYPSNQSPDSIIFPAEFPYCIDDTICSSPSLLNSSLESMRRGDERKCFLTDLTRFLARSSIHETPKLAFSKETGQLSGSRRTLPIPIVPSLTGYTDPCGAICEAVRQVYMGRDGSSLYSLPCEPNLTSFCCSGRHSQQFSQQDQLWRAYVMNCLGKETDLPFRRQEIPKALLMRSSFIPGSDNGRCGCLLGLSESTCPSLQQLHIQHNRFVSESGFRNDFVGANECFGGRRPSAGTGVFLPRGHGMFSEYCKKPDAMVATGNGILTEQQQNRSLLQDRVTRNNEIRLPQEWTY